MDVPLAPTRLAPTAQVPQSQVTGLAAALALLAPLASAQWTGNPTLTTTASSASAVTTGMAVNLTDSTTGTGGYNGLAINVSGSGTGTGNKSPFSVSVGGSTNFSVGTKTSLFQFGDLGYGSASKLTAGVYIATTAGSAAGDTNRYSIAGGSSNGTTNWSITTFGDFVSNGPNGITIAGSVMASGSNNSLGGMNFGNASLWRAGLPNTSGVLIGSTGSITLGAQAFSSAGDMIDAATGTFTHSSGQGNGLLVKPDRQHHGNSSPDRI